MALTPLGSVAIPPFRASAFDHGDVHLATGRIFVAHTAGDSLEVIDGEGRAHVQTIPSGRVSSSPPPVAPAGCCAPFTSTVVLFAGLGLTGASSYRPLFVIYAAIGLLNLLLFLSLSSGVEAAHVEGTRRFVGLHRSTGTVTRLSALFGLDALAGGLVLQSMVAYWFHLRWGLSPAALGVLFFWVGVLSGLSLLAASWLAQRFGLLNTMVLTHLPSNLLLVLVPLAPAAWLAVLLFLARMSVSQMDVPTRKSYTMAVVDADERTAAAGITNVARTAASAVSPVLSGAALGAGALGLPFFVAGGLKVLYDGLIYLAFRNVHPPEEQGRLATRHSNT